MDKVSGVPKQRAIVVGSGVSGLQIASLLHEKGLEVTILEAREYIGGRIKEDRTLADFPIELGGEFIHGEESYHHKLAEECGAELIDESDSYIYVEYGGKLYNEDELVAKTTLFSRILDLDWTEFTEYDDSKGDITVSDYIKQNGFTEDLKHTVLGLIGTEWAADIDTLSLRGIKRWNAGWDFGEKNFLIKNMSISEILKKKFANVWDKVQLNTPVTDIIYGDNQEIKIKDKAGKTYTTDLVVISIPISQLKKEAIRFDPSLPTEKREAIQKLTMNPALKIFLNFREKFWQDDLGLLITEGPISIAWDSSAGEKSEKCNILTFFVNGKVALPLSDLSDHDIAQAALEQLKRIYGNEVEQKLEGYLVQNWTKEAYIEGAYSFPHINEDENTRKTIAEPVAKKIYFVGEAMSEKFSTISGALDSCYVAYDRIIQDLFGKSMH